MSLTILKGVEPGALHSYRVDQILALAGDGRLKDGSVCSSEFREYLRDQPTSTLRRYIQETLTKPFTDGGFAFQDLVNEAGRRLGFYVENGRYRGVMNQSGQDGLWESTQMSFVVEVKTTDAYRINLSTVATYAHSVRPKLKNPSSPLGIVYVVGRQDTGDLEAQIRGSRYAWDVRLISAEALLDLANLIEVAVDEETATALRSSLLPVEYTRVDHLVELLSKLAFDVERAVQIDQILDDESATPKVTKTDSPVNLVQSESLPTPDNLKRTILNSIQQNVSSALTKVSKSCYESPQGANYIISVSKRYSRPDQSYWFAFQSKWAEKLSCSGSFLCLGMLDRDYFYKIPGKMAIEFTSFLNKTVKPNSTYWHIGLFEKGDSILLNLPITSRFIDLAEFKVKL